MILRNGKVLCGPIGKKDKPFQYIKSGGIALMPSRREGLPIAALEILSVGIPIIASDINPLDIVKDNFNGFRFNIEDESDLGFTAPPLEVGAPPGREAAQETIVEDQVKEEPMQTIPEATSVPSAQTQTQGQMFTNKDKVDYGDMEKYNMLGLYTNYQNPDYLDFDNKLAIETQPTITPKEKPITTRK